MMPNFAFFSILTTFLITLHSSLTTCKIMKESCSIVHKWESVCITGCPALKKRPKINSENVGTEFSMISIKEAIGIIRNSVEKEREIEVISTSCAYGRILSQNIYSFRDSPKFRVSFKDGYAVLASDGKGSRKVLCNITAEFTSTLISLEPGTCVRVYKGDRIPDDVTAVVQNEDTRLISYVKMDEWIEIMVEPQDGQNIRPIGCDIEKETLLLNAYINLTTIRWKLLERGGCKHVTVTKIPVIGVLSTDDELEA